MEDYTLTLLKSGFSKLLNGEALPSSLLPSWSTTFNLLCCYFFWILSGKHETDASSKKAEPGRGASNPS